jgi:hypothetical protein
VPWGATALCGISGLIRFTRTEFDLRRAVITNESSLDLAEVIGELIPGPAGADEPAGANALARELYHALLPLWWRLARGLDEPFLAPHRLTDLLYANRGPSGLAFIASIPIRHCLRRSDSGFYESLIQLPQVRPLFHGRAERACFFARGRTECFDSIPLGRDSSDEDAVRVLNAIFQRAAGDPRCASVVGGPVDIAVIDSSGRHWLQQKTCNLAAKAIVRDW